MPGPRLILAAAAGAALGVLSEWLVLRAPFALLPLTNSAGPWVLLAFLVALTARRTNEALLLALLTLFALIAGFYVAQATRGWEVSRRQVAFWLLVGFVAGPLIGLAADWIRRRGPMLAALGAGLVGGILVGESVHGLREYGFLTPHGYWWIQLVLGVALAIGTTLWRSRGRPDVAAAACAVSLASCSVFGIVTLIVYEVA